jgi:hypothetical protein
MDNICPICKKAGLPDYRIQHTICPQCGSDLRPYMLLHKIAKSNRSFLFIIAFIAIISLLIGSLYIDSKIKKSNLILQYSQSLTMMKDSVCILKDEIKELQMYQPTNSISDKEVTIIYKVKKDDCISKIAMMFYNDLLKYEKIAADNNIQKPYNLSIGQPLIIKINQN